MLANLLLKLMTIVKIKMLLHLLLHQLLLLRENLYLLLLTFEEKVDLNYLS